MSIAKQKGSYDTLNLRAVEVAENKSKEAATRQCGIDARIICEQCHSQKEKLVELRNVAGPSKDDWRRTTKSATRGQARETLSTGSRIGAAGIYSCAS